MSIKFKVVLFISTLLILFMSSASATCVRNDDGAVISDQDAGQGNPDPILRDSVNGMTDQCSAIPDAYSVNFYKLGICTADPSNNDLSSCQFMLDSSAVNGVPHTISYPAESALATGEFEISPGSYGYMIGILSNKLGVKHTETFSEQLKGANGSGTSCWTNGLMTAISGDSYTHLVHGFINSANSSSSALDCGSADDALPVISHEVIDTMGDGCSNVTFSATQTGISMSSGTAGATLLQNDGITEATGCANASRMLWTIDLTTPLVVTPETGFTLSFKLTDTVSIDAADDGNGVAMMIKMGADPFQPILTTR